MLKNLVFPLALLLAMSSCTMILLEEIRGGHSPMMQVDGEWNIEEHVVIESGETTDIKESHRCDFDATQDVGDYCVGEWLERVIPGNSDFLWGVDEDGSIFKLQSDGQDVFWKVITLEKDHLHLERNVNEKTYRMVLRR